MRIKERVVVSNRDEKVKMSKSISQDLPILTDTTKTEKSTYSEDLEAISTMLMKHCSRFDSCDAPKCPLDPLIDSRLDLEGNDKCGMAKATRHRYWESMPDRLKRYLPYEGYFRTELTRMSTARRKWDSLTEEEKSIIKERGRQALATHRGEPK